MKTCTVCKETKPLSDFYNRKLSFDGKFYRCKVCDGIAHKKFRNKHYDRYLEQSRKKNIKHKYGLSVDDYEALRTKQNYLCAICGLHESHNKSPGPLQGAKRLSVDHCHETGKVRGLLCNNCNRGLGFLGDTVERLTSVLRYLEGNDNRSKTNIHSEVVFPQPY